MFFLPFSWENHPSSSTNQPTQGTSWWRWPRCWDLTWHHSNTRRAELVSLVPKIRDFFIIYSFYLYQYLRVGGWFQLSTHLQKYAQLSNLDHETPRIGVTKTKYLSCHHLEWAWYGYTSIYQPPNLTRHIDMSKWRLRHSIVKPSLPELHGTSFFWKLPSFGNLPQKSFKRSSINKTLENKHLIIPSGLYHLNPH